MKNMMFVSLMAAGFLVLSFQNCGTGFTLGSNQSSSDNGEDSNPPNTSDPVSIFVGSVHTCIVQAGKLTCWGDNRFGMLGNGTTVDTSVPFDVSGLGSGVTKVATTWSHHICALHNGIIKCWGQNANGTLGDGTNVHRYLPAAVAGLPAGASDISGGAYLTCAKYDGSLKCWGSPHDGTTTTVGPAFLPQDFGPLSAGVEDYDIGFWHSCAVVNGAAKCWGANDHGQIGDGTTMPRLVPVDVSGLGSGVTQIAVGQYFSCALQNGVPKCWGQGTMGELGNGASVDSSTPVTVNGITDAVQLSVTYNTGCVVRSTGGVKCWGFSAGGTLGNGGSFGSVSNTPVDVVGLDSNVTQLDGTGNHFCVVQNNVPKCWGAGFKGKLGDGTLADRNAPVEVVRTRSTATSPTSVANIVSVTADNAGPIARNTPILWTVNATPANTPLEYRYSIYNEDTSTWIYQPTYYVDQNYLRFNPDAAGNYHMQVWVRAKGKTVDYDDWENSVSFQAN